MGGKQYKVMILSSVENNVKLNTAVFPLYSISISVPPLQL